MKRTATHRRQIPRVGLVLTVTWHVVMHKNYPVQQVFFVHICTVKHLLKRKQQATTLQVLVEGFTAFSFLISCLAKFAFIEAASLVNSLPTRFCYCNI